MSVININSFHLISGLSTLKASTEPNFYGRKVSQGIKKSLFVLAALFLAGVNAKNEERPFHLASSLVERVNPLFRMHCQTNIDPSCEILTYLEGISKKVSITCLNAQFKGFITDEAVHGRTTCPKDKIGKRAVDKSFDGSLREGKWSSWTWGKSCVDCYGENTNDGLNGWGINTFNDNAGYEGEWKKGARSGWGVLKDESGSFKIEGYWENDKPNGWAKHTLPHYSYEGYWKDGKYEGWGVWHSDQFCTRYIGGWKEGSQYGKGVLEYGIGWLHKPFFCNRIWGASLPDFFNCHIEMITNWMTGKKPPKIAITKEYNEFNGVGKEFRN